MNIARTEPWKQVAAFKVQTAPGKSFVVMGNGFQDSSGEEIKAMMMNITASPILLRAVIDAEQFIRGFEDDATQPSVKHLCRQLRDAIADATGGTL